MEIDEDKDSVVDAHKKLSSRPPQTKGEKIVPNDLFKTPTKNSENEKERQGQNQNPSSNTNSNPNRSPNSNANAVANQNQNQTLDSSSSSTPLKLEVSESENDDESDVDEAELYPIKYKQIIEKKILLVKKHFLEGNEHSSAKIIRSKLGSVSVTDASSSNAAADFLSSPQSNSSDEYVLGFDELSGLVHTIKDNQLTFPQYLAILDDQETEKLLDDIPEENLISSEPESTESSESDSESDSTPTTSKRLKMNTPKTSPKLAIQQTPQKDTNNVKKKPEIKKTNSNSKENNDEKSSSTKKMHVVGDNDEIPPTPNPTPTSTANTTPTSIPNATPSELSQNPPTKADILANIKLKENRFKKPFELGWKREVVWRIHPSGKEKADIFFVSPIGKKLRSRNEIMPLIANNKNNLEIEDFCFAREPLGLGEEFEIVRHAKNLSRSSLSLPPPNSEIPNSPTTIGKRISKPKVPKGASPPPEGWTPAKALKMNNTALQTGRNPSTITNSAATNSSSSTSTKRSSSSNQQTGTSSTKSSRNKKSSNSNSVEKINNAPSTSSASSSNSNATKKDNLCNGKCIKPQATIKIRCKKCSQTFHPECVGLKSNNCEFKIVNDSEGKNENKRNYLCETCNSTSKVSNNTEKKEKEKKRRGGSGSGSGEEKSKSSLAAVTSSTAGSAPSTASSSSSSTAAAAASSVPVASPIIPDIKYPQTLAVVKGKKYVMVSKPVISNVQKDADNEELKKKVSKTIRNIKKARLEQGALAGPNPIIPSLINSNQQFAANFFSNVSSGYESLIHILKYLKIHERSRAASVCKLWYLATKDPAFWNTVRMKNSKVCDWTGFASALRRGETKHLDLRKMLLSSNSRSEEAWKDFLQQIGTVCTLEIIDMCRCSAKVIETLFQSNKNLRILNALAINDTILDLTNVKEMHNLEELRLRPFDSGKLKTGLLPLQDLKNIKHLSLTGINNLGAQGLEILGDLITLQSLELGECGQFENNFSQNILPKLKDLKSLRMENNQYSTCETLTIVKAISSMKNLEQLELVNFDIKPGFDVQLSECKQLKKLLIIPTYISQSATTNNVVLSAVQKISKTIQVFTWGVTIELLRVTALYVDQCDGSSKKEKQFDECIPVLKPVPGATTLLDDESKDDSVEEETESDVPQIEILPLERVETILANNLPTTKYFIVKIPYHATCKQHLVE